LVWLPRGQGSPRIFRSLQTVLALVSGTETIPQGDINDAERARPSFAECVDLRGNPIHLPWGPSQADSQARHAAYANCVVCDHQRERRPKTVWTKYATQIHYSSLHAACNIITNTKFDKPIDDAIHFFRIIDAPLYNSARSI
jgi:hypothetical protein